MDKNKLNVNKTPSFLNKEPAHVNKPTHRYFCDACTGVAFLITEGANSGKATSNCKSCGAALGIIKKQNFIKL